MKVPKYRYIPCTDRCPRQTACRYNQAFSRAYKCVLKSYINKMDRVHNLIRILEVEDENT